MLFSVFHGTAWGAGIGVDPEDLETNIVRDVLEIINHNPKGAYELLIKALSSDMRYIDAHAHPGNHFFDHWPKGSMAHYEVGIGI